MELRFVVPDLRHLDGVGSEVLACGLFSDALPPHGTAGLLDWRLCGQVSRLLESGFLTALKGEVMMLPLRPKLPFDKALLFGLGPRAAFDDTVFREVTAHMLGAVQELCARSAVVELPGRFEHSRTGVDAERAADILLDLAGSHPEHDVWTLVEPSDAQKKITAHMTEQRRRDRRVVLR
jgi:hypothetical protein